MTKAKITTLAWVFNAPAFEIQSAVLLLPKVMNERKLAIKNNI